MCLLRGTDFIYVYCILNRSKPSVHYMYRQLNIQNSTSAHTVYLCVLYGSENKERLFPNTAITDWFL